MSDSPPARTAQPSPGPATAAPVCIVAQGLACATGVGLASLAAALRQGRSALVCNAFTPVPLAAWVGVMAELEHTRLPAHWGHWDCRATRAAWLGLQADDFITAAQAACARHGATRVGLVLGTSASTVGVSELAYTQLAPDGGFPNAWRSESLNTIHAITHFVQEATGVQGPCVTVSTACSSSAKAFAQAQRWLQLGLVDAVVVAGVDALCNSVLFGFAALGLVAPQPCTPFAAARQGISIGEAAGFALLERGPGPLMLLGCGEANDAHHMSSPHPQGLGAERALDAALLHAGLQAHDVDLVSLHGTATPQNDAVEAALVARRYRADVHASAIKGCTGHTMGAAGIVATLMAAWAVREGLCPGTANTGAADPELGARFGQQLQLAPVQRRVRVAACHAFGFGGNNAVLLLGAGSA
jgi:3-oxoacyl-[acyl-carrier-protein] synthase I